jgi:hypothetical protein
VSKMRSWLFWGVKRLLVVTQVSGNPVGLILKRQETDSRLNKAPIVCPETPVTTNKHCGTSHNIEAHIFHYRIHKISPLGSILSDPVVFRCHIINSFPLLYQSAIPHICAVCSTHPSIPHLVTAVTGKQQTCTFAI